MTSLPEGGDGVCQNAKTVTDKLRSCQYNMSNIPMPASVLHQRVPRYSRYSRESHRRRNPAEGVKRRKAAILPQRFGGMANETEAGAGKTGNGGRKMLYFGTRPKSARPAAKLFQGANVSRRAFRYIGWEMAKREMHGRLAPASRRREFKSQSTFPNEGPCAP